MLLSMQCTVRVCWGIRKDSMGRKEWRGALKSTVTWEGSEDIFSKCAKSAALRGDGRVPGELWWSGGWVYVGRRRGET